MLKGNSEELRVIETAVAILVILIISAYYFHSVKDFSALGCDASMLITIQAPQK